jgi:hypothetical protein
MKRAAILGLTTIISIVLTTISLKVDSAPKKLTDWDRAKANWNKMLTELPTPSPFENKLVDVTGAKSTCHAMGYSSNPENRYVVNLNCWGEKGRAFPALAAQWVAANTELSTKANTDPAPPAVGNTLVDSNDIQYDCHLTNYLTNNEGVPVSGWTCWSKSKHLPIK